MINPAAVKLSTNVTTSIHYKMGSMYEDVLYDDNNDEEK